MDPLPQHNSQTASFSINADNGGQVILYLEPMNANMISTPAMVYGIYRTDSKDDTLFDHLSIAPERGETIPGLDDINKKNYLGEINLSNNENGWEYDGTQLSVAEQQQVANHIKDNL